MTSRPETCSIVEAFEKVQQRLLGFGATDTEPDACFRTLMREALSGKPWQEPMPEAWQLFSDQTGWRKASRQLTAAAKKAYKAVQRLNIVDAQALARWYGWS